MIKSNSKQSQNSSLFDFVFLISQQILTSLDYIDMLMRYITKKNRGYYRQINALSLISSRAQRPSEDMRSTTIGSYSYHGEHKQFNQQSSFNRKSKQFICNENEVVIGAARERNRMNHTQFVIKRQTKNRNDLKEYHKLHEHFTYIEVVTNDILDDQTLISYIKNQQMVGGMAIDIDAIALLLQEGVKQETEGFYRLNMQRIFSKVTASCIQNYQQLVQMQLQSIEVKSVEEIFRLLREISCGATQEFIQSTKMFMMEEMYLEYYHRLQSCLEKEESQLMSGFAQAKYELGNRKLRCFQTENISQFLFQKILGRSQINDLNIGYKMYLRILKQRQPQVFHQLQHNKRSFRKQKQFNSQNKTQMLNNIENRIEIYQEKKRYLEMGIALGEKEAEYLKELFDALEDQDRKDKKFFS